MPRPDCLPQATTPPSPLRLAWQPALLVPLVLLLNGGCRAADQVPLHWPVASPPPLQSENPVLWVALAARLGPQAPGPSASSPGAAAAAPLRLKAASGTLTLEDGAGQRVEAPDVTLHWRWSPLPQPVVFRRRVLGPFASYETAEAAARSWASSGLNPVLARPLDWEVWAPADAPDPPGRSARLVERRESRRLVLEIRRPQGVMALQGPIRLEAPAGLRWGTGVYKGPFRLLADAHGGWTLLEEVPLERYLEGVVPHEIGAASPPAALAAQAVLARTWAVRNRGRYGADGYHLCADTQCQVYSDPAQASPAVRQAIASSRAKVLAAGDQPIHAVYHASNGGVAAGLEEAWDVEPVPYLRAFADGGATFQGQHPLPITAQTLPLLIRNGQGAYGVDHPLFRWQRTLTAGAVSSALAARGLSVGVPRSLKVLERGPSGRTIALEIGGSQATLVLRRDAIRRTLRQLPSTLFTLTPSQSGGWSIQGGGFGHGAGLSQAGAIDLAGRGWTMDAILQHYYPGADLQPLGAIRLRQPGDI